uniref:Salivary lipocalin n=1 Tax=Triatoma matogrossensis TaxID=162370 RepID=E2J708_9HEMI
MKMIITVIFAGILTYTGAQKTGCQVPTGLQAMGRVEFQMHSFFSGSWYVTHMKDASNSYDAVCREYKTKVGKKVIKLDADGDYTLKGAKKHYTTTCSSDIQPMPYGSSRFECQHSRVDGDTSHSIFFTVLWSIIETDYQNYALAYRCTAYYDKSIHTGNLVLLQRDKTADGSKAASSLAKYSLALSAFTKLC